MAEGKRGVATGKRSMAEGGERGVAEGGEEGVGTEEGGAIAGCPQAMECY